MTLYTSLVARLTARSEPTWMADLAVIAAGSLLMTVAAKTSIPFYPVPLSMQTFVAIGLGLALGPVRGALCVLFYLMQGAAGLPVFAGTPEKGVGLAYMMGPTGGYLFGYLFAATLTGWLAERGFDRTLPAAALALLIGNLAIYLPGLAWLGSVVGWDKPVLQYGLIPFLAGDALKLALGACLLPLLRHAATARKG